MKYSIAALLLINSVEAVKIERDPLFSTPDRNEWAFRIPAIKKGPPYPMDYPVPNFG